MNFIRKNFDFFHANTCPVCGSEVAKNADPNSGVSLSFWHVCTKFFIYGSMVFLQCKSNLGVRPRQAIFALKNI